jgi:hypothetical protein
LNTPQFNAPTGIPASTDQVDGQLDIFAQEPATDADPTPSEAFEKFHNDNPHFYDALVELARRYITRTGRGIVGMQRLIEVARFDMDLTTQSDDEFKVNNNHAAFYSRLIMLQEPDLAGTIPTRRSPEADTWIALRKHGRAA